VIAGYSVGELAAWGCSGTLDMPAALRLAECRADVMDAAAPKGSGLAAVVGLRRSVLEPILRRCATYIAIVNDTDSFVIGGPGTALDASCREAAASGATRTVRLRVAVPAHTPLLAEAARAFRVVLRETAPRPPQAGLRLLSGIDGDAVLDVETGCDKLAGQICTSIDWAACLESCRSAGAVLALELGPGTALSRMAAPWFPDGCARSTEEFRTLAGLRAWLSRDRTR
jgi:[acyl-carrier-protein] S-malonyltransferase